MSESKKISIGIIMIGDSKVGKTTLMKRFIDGNYYEGLPRTCGVEVYKKDIIINNKGYLYKIWDTCGQERFRSLTKSYFQNADGIMLLFDLNNIESFNNLKNWFDSINECNKDDVPLVIVGTKSDLECKISDQLINKLENDRYKNKELKVFKCSAKNNCGVAEPFMDLAEKIICSINSGKGDKHSGRKVKITKGGNGKNKKNKEEKKKCCH